VDRRGTAWAASGAMMLTGRRHGPGLGAPAALIDLVQRAAAMVSRRSGGRAAVDGLALLGERAALSNLARQGAVSCGGSTRLVRSADGWLAVSLARPDDVAALPAWLCRDIPADDPWPHVHEAAVLTASADLDERAALLGLPFAALGSVEAPSSSALGVPVGVCLHAPGAAPRAIDGATVVDLSSLWAGPLCGQLLALAGADVIKVESTARPDGARLGPPSFFDLLNGSKRSVALDLAAAAGQRQLRRLLSSADVVIESARPRALEQMGIVAADVLRSPRAPRVWLSVTSHGRAPGRAHRTGFGDVAAVAGGLVARDDAGPCFLADAVADPLAGLVGAAGVVEALSTGGHWLLDAAMAPIAASAAGPLLEVSGEQAQAPRARPIERRAPALGSDTAAVLRDLAP
jgi:hypothetical protein